MKDHLYRVITTILFVQVALHIERLRMPRIPPSRHNSWVHASRRNLKVISQDNTHILPKVLAASRLRPFRAAVATCAGARCRRKWPGVRNVLNLASSLRRVGQIEALARYWVIRACLDGSHVGSLVTNKHKWELDSMHIDIQRSCGGT